MNKYRVDSDESVISYQVLRMIYTKVVAIRFVSAASCDGVEDEEERQYDMT